MACRVGVERWGVIPQGHVSEGIEVDRVELTAHGHSCKLITLGCTVTELKVDMGDGCIDVVLGFDDLDSYASRSPFFGCVVGRHAGRLEPQFTIDGEAYNVAGSDGGGGGIDVRTNLHGGTVGWDKRVWKVIAQGTAADSASVTFAYTSPHLEEGFPGEVQAELTYRLTTGGELHLEYAASVDRPTIVSMTNHTYFNLNRDHTDGIRDHTLVLECAEYARCDASGTGVPTGELAPVGGTVHDFQEPKVLGPAIDAIARESPLWPHGEGFIIAENRGRDANQLGGGGMADLATVAILGCPASRLVLTVLSSEPQVQTYYATLLDPTVGKHGTVYNKHGAICLETHRCANAVNRPAFPSQIIRPGDPYRQHTVWRFTAQ